jgi:hypothetical protein
MKFYIASNDAFYILPIAIISVLIILHIHLGFIFNKKNQKS